MRVYVVSEHALEEARKGENGHFSLSGEPKCGECNWEQSRLFVLACSQKEADALYLSGDAGLCGECFAEFLQEENYKISR